jgi:hypothetical protein
MLTKLEANSTNLAGIIVGGVLVFDAIVSL